MQGGSYNHACFQGGNAYLQGLLFSGFFLWSDLSMRCFRFFMGFDRALFQLSTFFRSRRFFTRIIAIFFALPILLAFSDPAQAGVILLANGGNWDVNDVEHTVFSPRDTGSIVDGYRDAYDRWGHLHLRVMDTSNNIIGTSGILNG